MGNAPTVLLTDPISNDALEVISSKARVEYLKGKSFNDFVKGVGSASVIVVRSSLPEGVFAYAPELLGVIRHGAGVDMIPIDEATEHGIAVANVPGVNALTVAEYALGQILNLGHQLTQTHILMREQGWAIARSSVSTKVEIAGSTLGIVGFGHIGEAIAQKAHSGLGMKVISYRPSNKSFPAHVERVNLDALFERSDFIVLACPLTEETTSLVDVDLLNRMKPTACLINVARGPVINEQALIKILSENRIRGAALDVFETQPLPHESDLMKLDNVLLSSHMAGITQNSMHRMGMLVAQQALQILDGELPKYLYNTDSAERIKERFDRVLA